MKYPRIHVTDRNPHRGYTILELMISLALLATLMIVAWSILGSYRVAEERGWNQTYQMQMIRVTRSWLESDAAHFAEPRSVASVFEEDTGPPSRMSEMTVFKGDEQGFEVDVIPSVDPLPWLEEVTRQAESLSTTTQAMNLENENPAIALDPLAVYHLRYEIVAATGFVAATGVDSEEETFQLDRELLPIDRWSAASPSRASEKLLSTEDLYRLTDDEALSETTTVTERQVASIRNLVAPRFRYSDGSSWIGQWDSQLKGGLPRAIELSFDLPAASSPYAAVDPEPSDSDTFVAEDFASSEVASDIVETAEVAVSATEDDDALGRDVRIVVLVPGSGLREVKSD
ncbi:hypothetical protein CA13_22780 [Planctomycetes bacterium CA13]|uniref:Pseudopilin GspJ n=1 Tax=Novipirellula herctigrandis TaxID=2527986 RepID=A0A5C5Z0C7_9BACT|nr:hypothetical protein CA13_22780 [Planctomycetes bacterium CA13]